MKIKDILIVYHEPTKSVLTALEKFLEKRAECVCCERTGLDECLFRKKDLVIVIGGDGTFLRASHFVKDELIFGINPEDKLVFYKMRRNRNRRKKKRNQNPPERSPRKPSRKRRKGFLQGLSRRISWRSWRGFWTGDSRLQNF